MQAENMKKVLEEAEIDTKAGTIKGLLNPKKTATKNASKKRPKSAYIIFCGAKRAETKAANPEATPQEITSMVMSRVAD